ncbi:hypothetical protein GmHk_20G056884 [Glycine max]|nr:hypothetical protein GmHk_20G056884 [Glycine max]
MLAVVPKVLEREYEEEKTVLLPLPHPLPLRWSGTPNSLSSASKRGLAGGSTASTSGTDPDRTSPCSSAPRPSPLTGVGVHVQLDVLFSSLLNLVSDRENMLEVLPEDSALNERVAGGVGLGEPGAKEGVMNGVVMVEVEEDVGGIGVIRIFNRGKRIESYDDKGPAIDAVVWYDGEEPPLSTTERSVVEAGPNASYLTKKEEEDLQHLKNLGINSYRMSISWSRLLPIK